MVTRSAAAAAPQSALVQLSPTSPSQSSVEESAWQGLGVETWGSSSDDDDDDDDNENNDDDDDDDDSDDDDDHTDNETDEDNEDDGAAFVPEVVDRSLQTDRAASETKPLARPQMSNTKRIIWAHQAWLNKKNAGTATAAAGSADANGHGTTTALPGASSSKTQTPVVPPPEPLKAPTERRPGSPIERLLDGGVDTPQVPSPAVVKQGLADTTATKPPWAPVTPVPQKKSPAASASKSPVGSVRGKRTSNQASPKNIGHFLLASNNMPYTVWVDPNGTPVPARGALLPAEYKLHDDPDFPFICPIRSCRRTLPNLFALGGHFNAGHSHIQVHDNLDGTFTQLGKYTNTTRSHPCIVVSQGPPPPGALPPVEPRLPDTLHKNKRHLPYVGGGRAKRQMIRTLTQIRAAQKEAKFASKQALVEQPLEQARFAPDLLSRQAPSRDVATGPGTPCTSTATLVSPPQTMTQAAPTSGQYGPGSIRQSILARLRADRYSPRALSQSTQGAVARVQADEDLSGERPDMCSPNAQSIAARLQADKDASIERPDTYSPNAQSLVAQLQANKDVSGERPHKDAPNAETTRARLQTDKNVSSERPDTRSSNAQSIVACLEADKGVSSERPYTRSPSAQGVMARLQADKGVSSERPYTRSPSAQGVMARLQADKSVSSERPHTRSPSAQGVMARLQADKGVSSERPHTRSPSAQSIVARLEADKGVSIERSNTRSPSARQTQQVAPPSESPLNDSSEQLAPEQANLEMEPWEIAPGRVTGKDSLQNVAFSGPFLASSKPIVVCSDIAFNVLTIRPGQSHHTIVQRDKIQLYAVASGKVHVMTGGVSVALGANGVKTKEPHTIENFVPSADHLRYDFIRNNTQPSTIKKSAMPADLSCWRRPAQHLPLIPHLLIVPILLAIATIISLFVHSDVNAALLWSQCHAHSILSPLSRLPIIGTPACFRISFLLAALDSLSSKAVLSVVLAFIGALLTVSTVESARRVNAGNRIVSRPTLPWLVYTLVGGALVWQLVIVPAFMVAAKMWPMSLRGSRLGRGDTRRRGGHGDEDEGEHEDENDDELEHEIRCREVAKTDVIAIPLAVALGFYVPSALMLAAPSPIIISTWLFFPVCVSLLRQVTRYILSKMARFRAAPSCHLESHTRTVMCVYALPVLASVLAHSFFLVASLTQPDDRKELTRSTVRFIEIDYEYIGLTLLYWVFVEVGWPTPLVIAGSSVLLGPGAGTALGWLYREKLLTSDMDLRRLGSGRNADEERGRGRGRGGGDGDGEADEQTPLVQ
ncbi:hypothetical protein E4U58_001400 [Claviceps cyperi]|nr:hypothetical protein E4U58_001400 [Claviceps cyperi]